MLSVSLRKIGGAVTCLAAVSLHASAANVSQPQAVTTTLPDSYYVDWQVEQQDAQPYRIFVSVPEGEAPAEGFPVVYLMDGNAFFSAAVSISKKLVHPRFENKQPAIIVGLGYPIEGTHDVERRWWDLTPPSEGKPALPPKLEQRLDDMRFGGAQQMLSLLVDDIRPWLAEQYAINPSEQILFGHSLGGLFTLYALHTRPDAFQGYGAISPSLWWNDGYVKSLLTQQSTPNAHSKQIFMAMGEREADYMLKDAQWAQDLFQEKGLTSEYRVLPYMNHGTVAPAALTMTLEELLPSQPTDNTPQ